ncbi:MAG: hypothetical protein E6848_19880, partial [Bradyrhizobium sp.]|nr:hypothetical protein [Bradyrhizobium sp.]
VVPTGSVTKQKAPSDAGGAWWNDRVVENLAHDSSHGPAAAGRMFTVGAAHDVDHDLQLARTSREIKACSSCARR